MMLKRVRISWIEGRGWVVDLPSALMVPGTFDPVVPGLVHADGVVPGAAVADVVTVGVSVLVELVDEDLVGADGIVDAVRVRRRYAQHARFGAGSWVGPRLR